MHEIEIPDPQTRMAPVTRTRGTRPQVPARTSYTLSLSALCARAASYCKLILDLNIRILTSCMAATWPTACYDALPSQRSFPRRRSHSRSRSQPLFC